MRRGWRIARVEMLQTPVRIAGVDVHTSPSIGIAFYPPGRQQHRGAHGACRCRDVLRETARPRQRTMLRRWHGRGHRQPRAARERPAPGHRSAAIRALLSAQGAHATRRGTQRRGADSLDPPATRPDHARRLHSSRRGLRSDRRHRRMGGAGSLPAGARLAATPGLRRCASR